MTVSAATPMTAAPRIPTPPPKSPSRPQQSRAHADSLSLAPTVRALGEFNLLLITGPTGVGKSRLLRELYAGTHSTIESDGTTTTPSWPATAPIVSQADQEEVEAMR